MSYARSHMKNQKPTSSTVANRTQFRINNRKNPIYSQLLTVTSIQSVLSPEILPLARFSRREQTIPISRVSGLAAPSVMQSAAGNSLGDK